MRMSDGWWRAAALLVAGALATAGLVLQSNTYLNHDLAWILYSATDMLRGAVFGRDVIAANPPLAWYLAMPPAALAEAIGAHPSAVFRGYVAALSAASLAVAWWLMRRDDRLTEPVDRRLFLLILCYLYFVGCYRDYGQREYLAVALSLPYLLMAAGRMTGQSYPLAVAISVGLAAGVGLALKPHFLLVPALVEVFVAIRARSLAAPLRPETAALAGIVALYAALLPLLAPAYLFTVLPQVRAIYWGFDTDLGTLFGRIGFELIGFAVAVYLATKHRGEWLQHALLAAAGGFLLVYLMQMKGYTYHGFPFRGLVALSLVLHVGRYFRTGDRAGVLADPARLLLAGIALFILIWVNLADVIRWYGSANRATGAAAARSDQLVALIDRHAAGGRFLALSTHPYPGFPLAIYSNAAWASRTNSRFFLPAIAKLRHAGSERDAAALRLAEDRAHAFLLHDLALQPRLILIDARPWKHGIGTLEFDILAFYLEHPKIRAIWRRYRELDPAWGFRVFVADEAVR